MSTRQFTTYKSENRQPKSVGQRLLILSIYSVVILISWNLGCKQKPPAESDANTPEPNTPTVSIKTIGDVDANSIAVTVNGIDITEGDIQELIEPRLDSLNAMAAQLPPEYIEQTIKNMRQWALEQLITEQLLDEKIIQAAIVVTEEDVLEKIKEAAAIQNPPLSLEDFRTKVEEYGQNFDELKQRLQKMLSYQKLMEGEAGDKFVATEADANQYYSENPDVFQTPEQVRASHILISPKTDEVGVDPNEAKAKAKAKAQELLEQIKAGADFAELARANSHDTLSAQQGGDLDFLSRGDMELPFEKAAFELKPEQVSDVIETSHGYHILKVTDRRDAGTVSFEQAKEDIINRLTEKKQAEFATAYIDSLVKSAAIVYPPGKEPTPAEPMLPGMQ